MTPEEFLRQHLEVLGIPPSFIIHINLVPPQPLDIEAEVKRGMVEIEEYLKTK